MLATVLIVSLATAPPPTAKLPPVPGTRLRFGMTEAQVLAAGSFITVGTPNQPGTTSRKGPIRFFGVAGEATVILRDGLLAEVKFEASGVGPHSQAYVDDQMRMVPLSRECQPDQPGDRVCDWTSSHSRVHVEIKKDLLTASAIPWPPPEPTHTPAASGAAGAAAGATAGTAAGATAGAAGHGAAAAVPVAVLPDTFTITPATRNKPDAWPRILPGAPVQYPEKAKQESIQGVVWMIALVDTSGAVMNATVERGIPELNAAALAWIKSSQFTPCRPKDAPCRYAVRVPAYFTLY